MPVIWSSTNKRYVIWDLPRVIAWVSAALTWRWLTENRWVSFILTLWFKVDSRTTGDTLWTRWVVPSAYRQSVNCRINIINGNIGKGGPNRLPWGTPHRTGSYSEELPLHLILWKRPVKYNCMNEPNQERMSYNPGQNYLRKFSPSCPLSYATKLFPKRRLCGKKTPSPNSMLLPTNAQGSGFLLNTQQHCFQGKGEREEPVQLRCFEKCCLSIQFSQQFCPRL